MCKSRRALSGVFSVVLLAGLSMPAPGWAGWGGTRQVSPTGPVRTVEEPVEFDRLNMSGPRFGVTYVPGENEITRRLRNEGMEPFLSQFGWHFERRVTPVGGGPQFVVETVPLVAGVEYGKLLPNISLAMGVRFPAGWEFGIGPNVMLTGLEGSDNLTTSLITAVGYSFQYSGVSLPVNLAFTTNPDGNRLSLLFGYAIRR